MKIRVTQQHIDDGIAGNCSLCPLALAVAQAFPGERVSVDDRRAYSNGRAYPLPHAAREFVGDFDANFEVYPFEFILL